MKKIKANLPKPAERAEHLDRMRTQKMARSPHRYVRGNTEQFYEWLSTPEATGIPEGPPVWICGDCHVGNLGPIADASGNIQVLIRDLDQTVVGNPAHDVIRLALSLASAARGSNLPGVATARILESIVDGYESAFESDDNEEAQNTGPPDAVRFAMKQASKRTWKHLAKERLEDSRPTIPLGKKFWPMSRDEHRAIEALFDDPSLHRVVTMVDSRDDDAEVELLDSAYWMKGCSSLGKLRFAVLLGVTGKSSRAVDYCIMDVKEAVPSVAPASSGAKMPGDDAERVVEGALNVSPFLGERMRAAHFLGRPVFIRELLPQDLKLEFEQLDSDEALRAAGYLSEVVGLAHARQMDSTTRQEWKKELLRQRSEDLDAPSWLWRSVVALLVDHEKTYLEHCRRYALDSSSE